LLIPPVHSHLHICLFFFCLTAETALAIVLPQFCAIHITGQPFALPCCAFAGLSQQLMRRALNKSGCTSIFMGCCTISCNGTQIFTKKQ